MPPKCPYCNEEVQFIQFYPESVKFLITSVFVTCLMECPKCKIQISYNKRIRHLSNGMPKM